jgi:hypothetical protein
MNEPYQTSFQSPVEDKVYGRSKLRKGCLLFPLFLLIIAGLIAGGYFAFSSLLFPNKIKGDLLDVTYVPGKTSESGYLWILTDGSFSYIQETKSPGRYSVGRKGIFCKTYTYVYDPVSKNIIKKIKTDYDELPPKPDMFTKDGKVWIVSQEQSVYEPIINVYDAESMNEVMDTKAFTKKFDEFSSGIINLRVEFDPVRFQIKTRDGQSFTYSVDLDKLFQNDHEMKQQLIKEGPQDATIFVLGEEKSGPRKLLYKVTGPADKVLTNSISESYLKDPKTLMFFTNSTAQQLTTDKVYLEGIILFQDKDAVVILHQDQVGKNASRILTCVDVNGKVRWTKTQDELFKKLAVIEDDPFSTIFFMKSKIKAVREGNILLFKFEPEGIIGFDYVTGKKLWTLEI